MKKRPIKKITVTRIPDIVKYLIGLLLTIITISLTIKGINQSRKEPLIKIVGTPLMIVDTLTFSQSSPPIMRQYFWNWNSIISFLNYGTHNIVITPHLLTTEEAYLKNVGDKKGTIIILSLADSSTYSPFMRDYLFNPDLIKEKSNSKEALFEEFFNDELLPNDSIKITSGNSLTFGIGTEETIKHILIVYQDEDRVYDTYYIMRFKMNNPLFSLRGVDMNNGKIYIAVDSTRIKKYFIYDRERIKISTKKYNRRETKKILVKHKRFSKKLIKERSTSK